MVVTMNGTPNPVAVDPSPRVAEDVDSLGEEKAAGPTVAPAVPSYYFTTSEWREELAPNGAPYWWHTQTRDVSWVKPGAAYSTARVVRTKPARTEKSPPKVRVPEPPKNSQSVLPTGKVLCQVEGKKMWKIPNPEWIEAEDKELGVYYWNATTKATCWRQPMMWTTGEKGTGVPAGDIETPVPKEEKKRIGERWSMTGVQTPWH